MTAPKANRLRDFFDSADHREIDKWLHYFDIYERHFDRYRGQHPVVLEFGVFHGGSLQMWRDYFGPGARIHGVDINPACARLADAGTSIHIGDQGDRGFLRSLVDTIGEPVDVVVDDGGHEFSQQIATFEEIYPGMAPDGVYLVEDLHTSYWPSYGGGLRVRGTFIEYAKNLIDRLNAWHSNQSDLAVDRFTRSTRSMHVYPSVIVLERGAVEPPESRRSGTPSLTQDELVSEQLPRPWTAPTTSRWRALLRRARGLWRVERSGR